MIRALADVRGQTYEEKLKDAQLTTLKDRRTRGDAIEIFKTLNGFNHVDVAQWFKVVGEEARPTRANTTIGEEGEERRECVLEVERASLEIRRNFFHIRAAKEWNSIPDPVKKQKTVNGFKTAYDAWIRRLPITIQPDSATSEKDSERHDQN